MAELLASNRDINRWLPGDKLVATDTNTAEFQIDAWQLIRGQLASSFPTTVLATWTNPTNTPATIRAIAGRLIAAYLYRETYSEDSVAIPAYAQELYNEAIAMLAQIRANTLIVLDGSGNPIDNELALTAGDFYPNDGAPGPFFTMTDRFG